VCVRAAGLPLLALGRQGGAAAGRRHLPHHASLQRRAALPGLLGAGGGELALPLSLSPHRPSSTPPVVVSCPPCSSSLGQVGELDRVDEREVAAALRRPRARRHELDQRSDLPSMLSLGRHRPPARARVHLRIGGRLRRLCRLAERGAAPLAPLATDHHVQLIARGCSSRTNSDE